MSDHVVGVITLGANPGLAQNLNFAVPCSEVQALLITAHRQATPLNSVASNSDGSFTKGIIWTSITSGRDYGIRQDGEYLYIDWVSIPPATKTAGGFSRSELKKTSDGKWRGKVHQRLPCTYTRGHGAFAQNVTNWCSHDLDIEIDLISDKRIEGISTGSEKFDCKKCEAQQLEQKPFTWIPK
jgi:hypothetical protein